MGYPEATTDTSYTFHAYPGEDWHPVFDFGVDNSVRSATWCGTTPMAMATADSRRLPIHLSSACPA